MADTYNLDRFLDAQADIYPVAVRELSGGRKTSHWIWFIFPQVAGLGRSATAQHYAIGSIGEAKAYLDHPLLGSRLHECLTTLQALPATSAEHVFGSLDAMKFRSSLTLFHRANPADRLVADALDRWFGGEEDQATLSLI